MSRTYDLICDDCKVFSWVGQDHYLYGKDGSYQSGAEAFLYHHADHHIRFSGDDNVSIEIEDNGYREVKWDDEEGDFFFGQLENGKWIKEDPAPFRTVGQL